MTVTDLLLQLVIGTINWIFNTELWSGVTIGWLFISVLIASFLIRKFIKGGHNNE